MWLVTHLLSLILFFFISKKDVYSKGYFMHEITKQTKIYKEKKETKKKRKQRRKLTTKEERAKERRERITRCESPSLRPVE